MTTGTSWFRPRRGWMGPRAMVPADTCYRMLDIYCWVLAVTGTLAALLVARSDLRNLLASPVYYLMAACIAANWVGTVLRGLPFLVRYGMFAAGVSMMEVGPAMTLGIMPNMALILLVLVTSVALFFGTSKALWTVLAFILVNMAIGWGWTRHALPLAIPGFQGAARFMDVTSVRVWMRVTVASAGLVLTAIFLMQLMLRETRRALEEARRALEQVRVEQEGRERAERAMREAQKFDALGRLATGVAHDVNNALCVVKLYSDMMGERSANPAFIHQGVSAIRVATASAEQLTHHLLAFSRSDTTRNAGVCDLCEVVRVEAKALGHMLPRNVQIRTELDGPVYVPLSHASMQEVILNLAINARDAMPSGGVLSMKVCVERPGGPDGPRAGRLEISDTGLGMDRAVRERIFEPFFTTKASGSGTGLGLSMVYGVVSGAGGSIEVESEIGRGSRFVIRLPEAVSAEEAQKPSPRIILAAARCRVLVVDDQPQLLEMFEQVLSSEGFPVTSAGNGAAALEALSSAQSPFGLLVVRGVMQGVPSSRVIDRAMSLNPDCRVIVASAYTPDELAALGVPTGGPCHYLAKPFDVNQLREAVNTVLARPD